MTLLSSWLVILAIAAAVALLASLATWGAARALDALQWLVDRLPA